MGKSKAPSPPNPKDTSAAATGTNISTAIANSYLNNANQITPDGKITYTNDGTYQSVTDPYTGKTYQIPNRTATTTLSDIGQQTKDQTDQASLNLGKVANSQSAFLQNYLGQPVDLSSENVANYTNTHFGDDFNRQWGTNQTDLENQLANRGVQQGSSAYTKALSDFNSNKANAYDNMHGNQYGLAQQSILTQRNQPLNEISALMSGSQVSQPAPAGYNPSQIATTDTAGIISNNYEQKLAQHQASNQNILGGLFGLGASFLGNPALKFSDRRLKSDIQRIGKLFNGIAIYSYTIDGRQEIGLLADEVQQVHPDAVHADESGFLKVDYLKAVA